MNKKAGFWDVLAWIVLALILLWLVLKTFGIINTPEWLIYAPIYGAAYLAGWQIHKLTVVARNVEEFRRFKEDTVREVNSIKLNCVKNHSKK